MLYVFVQLNIESAVNSCYMDSVLFSMFAMPSPSLNAMLTQTLSGKKAAEKKELQELILNDFVQPLRDSHRGLATTHVKKESMTKIRTMCRKLGWQADSQRSAVVVFYIVRAPCIYMSCQNSPCNSAKEPSYLL